MPVEPNKFDDAKLVEIRASQEDPFVQYFIVRDDIEMSAGKIAAQCAHGAQMMILRYHEIKLSFGIPKGGKYLIHHEHTEKWLNQSFRKVVLKGNAGDFKKVKEELDCFVVKDAGLTEVDPGTETVLVLWPMLKSKAPKFLQRLRVL